ncbi:hypothetical protein [Streptomyces sp. NPDC057386]|uniref:Glyoxalase-like domain-containing protein n=1 Tax=Streptomyces thermocoprophilus TaxID=78356 RepID=A0ABV5VCC2_9ACTN
MTQSVLWTYAFTDRPRDRFAAAHSFWTAVTGTRLPEPRGDHGESVAPLPSGTDACVKVQGFAEGDGSAHHELCGRGAPKLVAAAGRWPRARAAGCGRPSTGRRIRQACQRNAGAAHAGRCRTRRRPARSGVRSGSGGHPLAGRVTDVPGQHT